MQKLYDEVNSKDKHCVDTLYMSDELLMEHASMGMYYYINEHCKDAKRIVLVAGSGNNGADVIALSRLLHESFEVRLFVVDTKLSFMAQLQLKRALAVGVKTISRIDKADVLVDGLFGTGLNRALKGDMATLIERMNALEAFKIACDIPSGILQDSTVSDTVFKADVTLTMGALKRALFEDNAKEYTGSIKVLNLGVPSSAYQGKSSQFVLEECDLKLPHRSAKNRHKGHFGHAVTVMGDKKGAALLCATAALRSGAGLSTVYGKKECSVPSYIMLEHTLPHNMSAMALGMGLGNAISDDQLQQLINTDVPMVIDADMFYKAIMRHVLEHNVVLTPHPKEFVALLKVLDIATIDVVTLQASRMKYVDMFCAHYKQSVLVLKGANTIIAHNTTRYINPLGSAALSKGGSGDVLSGIILGLLAQGYKPLDAAVQASLMHVLASQKVESHDFAVLPTDIIDAIRHIAKA